MSLIDDDEEEEGGQQQEYYWQCRSCTFSENKSTFLACFLCNAMRPRTSIGNVGSVGDASKVVTNTGALRKTRSHAIASTWTCPKCTFAENESHLLCCRVCGTPRQNLNDQSMIGKHSNQALIDDDEDASTHSDHSSSTNSHTADATQALLLSLADQVASKDPYIAHLTRQGDSVSLLRLATRVSQDIVSTTEDQQVLANWVLMVLAREDTRFRQLLLANGAFAVCSELFQKATKSKTKRQGDKNAYKLGALAAATMAYMLPDANHDTLHYMQFEIKESRDFLVHQCNQHIKVGLSLPEVTVQELKAVGSKKVESHRHPQKRISRSSQHKQQANPKEIIYEEVKRLLKTLCDETEWETKKQLSSAVQLLQLAEQRTDARDAMVALDAFESFVNAFGCSQLKELRLAIAATMAHILKALYPRKIPLSGKCRREIEECLQALEVTGGAVTLDEKTTINAKTLRQLNWQARNYLCLYRSTRNLLRHRSDVPQPGTAPPRRPLPLSKPPTLAAKPLPLSKPPTLAAPPRTLENPNPIPKPSLLSQKSRSISSTIMIKPRLVKRQTTIVCSEIETAAYFLGSDNPKRVLDAIVSLIKVAREQPKQRAVMYNFGLQERLAAMAQSKHVASKLKLLAAMGIGYIVPSLDSSIWIELKDNINGCLQVLRSNTDVEFTVNGTHITRQEIQSLVENLGRCAASMDSNYDDSFSSRNLEAGPPLEMCWDVGELYLENNIAALLEVVSSCSCRSLDALLLLVTLVQKKGGAEEVVASDGVDVLLDILSGWSANSDEMRATAAMVLSFLLDLDDWESEDQRVKIHQSQDFLKGNVSLTRRLATKAGNKGRSPECLEPTSYNYCSDEGLLWVVILNSLGVACESNSWQWDDLESCRMLPPPATAVVLVAKTKEEHVFNVFNAQVATQLAEDLTGRLQIHKRKKKDQDEALDALTIPTLDISKADRPEFLGVSVHHLKHHFMKKVETTVGFSSATKFYELENLNEEWGFVRAQGGDAFCPIDGRKGAAYVHTLSGADHVGLANHMLSWTWSYSVRDVVGTLDGYCQTNNLDPKRAYVWICCLCINQWRVVESNKSGINSTHSTVDFESEFRSRVVGIGRVLVMMKPWGAPANLKRVWCLFEIFIALIEESCEVLIVMPRRERDRMAIQLFSSFGQSTSGRGVDSLYKVLHQIDLEKAQASVEEDRLHILGLIREKIGFQNVNREVRNRMRSWVRDMIDSVVEEREEHEEGMGDYNHLMTSSKLSYANFLKQAGDLYEQYGDFPAAHTQYKKCLDIRTRILGSDHLDVADIYSSIGQVWFARGSHRRALGNLMCSLRTRRKLLANNHPQMAKTYFVIGKLLHEMGDMDEALAMMEKCLAIQKEQLGRHRDSAVTYAYMGLLLGDEGGVDIARGLEMARDAQAILEEHLGEEHPDTAFVYSVIAKLLQQINPDESIALMKRSVDILEKSLGARHPALQGPYCSLGELLQKKGNYEASLNCYRNAVEISKDTLGGTNHVAVARLYAKMSVVLYLLQKEAIQSKRMHDKVMDILEHCENSSKDDKLVRIYCEAAEQFFSNGDPKATLLFFRRGLEVKGEMLVGVTNCDRASLAACYTAIDSVQNEEDSSSVVEDCRRCLRAPLKEDDSLAASQPTQLVSGVTTKWLESRRRSL